MFNTHGGKDCTSVANPFSPYSIIYDYGHFKVDNSFHVTAHSAMQLLISWALAALNGFTASTRLLHVGGGLSSFSHSESISRKQSWPCLSLCFISLRALSLIPRRIPILFHSAARGSSFWNTSFSFGLSSNWQIVQYYTCTTYTKFLTFCRYCMRLTL